MVLDTQLIGKHALVTGGTQGIGKAVIEALLGEGCSVSYCDRNANVHDFEDVFMGSGASVHGTVVDINDRKATQKWIVDRWKRKSRIDLLIANASTPDIDPSPRNWEGEFSTCLTGIVNLVEGTLPDMELSPYPSVTIICSPAPSNNNDTSRTGPFPSRGPIEAAQIRYTQDLALTLGPKGVRVNAICPGRFISSGNDSDGEEGSTPQTAMDWMSARTAGIPLQRFGTAREVANVVVFLASPLSAFVHGAVIRVDGGAHIRTSY